MFSVFTNGVFMKRVLFLALGCSFLACAQEAPKDEAAEEAAVAERQAKLQEARAAMLRKHGPMVTMRQSGPSILFRNMQAAVSHDVVTNVVENVGKVTRLPFVAEEAEPPKSVDPLELARGALASEDVGAAVLLVDVKGWPSLLMAPEQSWVIVNVDALREGADAEQLARRVQQQLWRAACFALGAADSRIEKCVMNIVTKPSDLDNLNIAPYPEYLGKMMQRARVLGMESRRIAPYRKAVEEGWAEAPSDEIEQAIWDEVKAAPAAQ